MRELDRNHIPRSCAIVGAGRLGTALAAALRATGLDVDGPLGRGSAPRDLFSFSPGQPFRGGGPVLAGQERLLHVRDDTPVDGEGHDRSVDFHQR